MHWSFHVLKHGSERLVLVFPVYDGSSEDLLRKPADRLGFANEVSYLGCEGQMATKLTKLWKVGVFCFYIASRAQ